MRYGLCLLLSAAVGLSVLGTQVEELRIGLIESLFGEKNSRAMDVEAAEFRRLMDSATKLGGNSARVKDARSLGEQLVNKKLEFGVCHGFELAWMQQQFPEAKFRPLVVAINKQPNVRSMVVVKNDGPIRKFAELQGKTLALSKNSKAYTRLFLDKCCQQAGAATDSFFSSVNKEFVNRDRKTKDMNSEVALDQVVDGKAQATAVDGIALKEYERLKPERFKMLRILESSEEFPPSPVVYVEGAVDSIKVAKYRDALLNFHKSSKEAASLLENWRLTQFIEVPADYDQQLRDVLKAFPAPN